MYKDTTESAKEVRKVLKATYPGVKFSVRVKRFAGGSSVDIIWTDGPTGCEVADLTAHLKGGEYLNEYIGTHRRISRAVTVAAAEACARHYGVDVPEVPGGELNPHLTSMALVGIGGNEAFCDRVHRACWSTSVYDTTPEEAFARVFP